MKIRKFGVLLASVMAGVCAFAATIIPFSGKTASAEGSYDAAQLITGIDTATEATVTAGDSKSAFVYTEVRGDTATLSDTVQATRSGILVTPNDTTVGYSGTINGTFKGDTKIDFSFPGDTVWGSHYKYSNAYGRYMALGAQPEGYFVFTFTDAVDTAKSFSVHIWRNRINSAGGTCAQVTSNKADGSVDKIVCVTTNANGGALRDNQWHYDTPKSHTPFGADAYADIDGNNYDSYIELKYDENGKLNVLMPTMYTFPQVTTMAVFDGTSAVNTTNKEYGLPEMPFVNGYTVTFESRTAAVSNSQFLLNNKAPSIPVRFEKITTGGVETNLASATLESEPAFVSADYSQITNLSAPTYAATYVVENNVTVLAPVGTDGDGNGVDITAETTVTVEKDGVVIEKNVGDVLDEVGAYKISYEYNGQNKSVEFTVYADYANIKDTPVTIAVKGEYPSGALVGDSIPVYGGTFTYDAEEYAAIPAQTVASVKVNGVAVSGLYTFETAGTYTLTYEAIADNAAVESNVKEYVIEVAESGFNTANLISLSGGNATVVSGHIGAGSSVHNGVLVTPIDTQTSYEGAINGTFSGDTRVDFSFPGETTRTPNNAGFAGAKGHFIFRVEDASDPDVFFEIGMIRNNLAGSNASGTSPYVRYNGNDYTFYNSKQDVQFRYDTTYGPVFGMDDYKYENNTWYNGEKAGQDIESYFKLEYDENGVLRVKMLIAKYRNRVGDEAKFEEIVLAVFDGVPFTMNANAEKPVYYTLPLMPFENGYKISFRSVLDAKTQSTPDTIVPFKLEKITTDDGTVTDLSAAILSNAPVWALGGGSTPDGGGTVPMPTPDTATINSVALRIDGSLNLMLDATAAEGYTIDAVKALYRGNEYTLSADDSGKYIFSEITPQYLDENVTFMVVAGGRTVYASTSISQYLTWLKDNGTTDEEKAVAVALENYGAAAEAFVGAEGAVAPTLDEVDQSAITSAKGSTATEGATVVIKSANLYFDNTVGIGVKFDMGETALEGAEIRAFVNGRKYGYESGAFTGVEGTVYSVTFMNVSPVNFDEVITIGVYDAEGNLISNEVTYSVNSYAKNVVSTAADYNLTMALYLYGEAVKAYAAV